MTLEELKQKHPKELAILLSVLKGERHENYEQCLKYANELDMLSSTNSAKAKEHLKKFIQEENEYHEARVKILQRITSSIIDSIFKPVNKVFRGNSVKIDLTGDEEKINTIVDYALKSVKGGYKKHSAEIVQLANRIDPNSWVVFDWKAFDNLNQTAEPYPFIAWSENVLDFDPKKYLVIKTSQETSNVIIPDETDETTKFILNNLNTVRSNITFYGKDVNIVASKIDSTDTSHGILIGSERFNIEVFEHNRDFLFAMQLGYDLSIEDKGATFISFYHSAISWLKKLIKLNSEFDIALTKLAHPQKVVALDDCPNPDCNKGILKETNATCGVCAGIGKVRQHRSTGLEIIAIDKPKSKEEEIAVGNLVHFIEIPVDSITFQKDTLEWLISKAKSAVYNAESLDKAQFSNTATGTEYSIDSLYDTLYQIANHAGEVALFYLKAIQKAKEIESEIEFKYSVQRDFKLKTLYTLMNDLKVAKDSGASPEIIIEIEFDIASILYANNTDKLLRYKARVKFLPFVDKTISEITSIMSSPFVLKKKKVLYTNFTDILNSAITNNPLFFTFNDSRQLELINIELDKLVLELDTTKLIGEV